MNAMLRLNFLVVCAGLTLGARVFAAETNALSSSEAPGITVQTQINGYLQIQEQLHDTQLAIERNRQQAEAAAKRNADDMAARIEALQQVIAAQRVSEVETMQKMQQFMLILAGAFGTIGLLVVLLMAYLQWRTVARLVELSSLRPPEFGLGNGRISPSLMAGASVEQSNARLFNMVDQLEKRILELKQATLAPLNETTSARRLTNRMERRRFRATAMSASPTCSPKASRCWSPTSRRRRWNVLMWRWGCIRNTPMRWSKRAARSKSWASSTRPLPVTTTRLKRTAE